MSERTIDVYAEILRAEPDFFKPKWVYEFSNGRKFYDDDSGETYRPVSPVSPEMTRVFQDSGVRVFEDTPTREFQDR